MGKGNIIIQQNYYSDRIFVQGMHELYQLLYHAFSSLYSIQALDVWSNLHNSGKELTGNVRRILNHNRSILMYDLALSICKALDKDSKSASLYQMQSRYKKLIGNNSLQMPTYLKRMDDNCVKRIHTIRNEYISHLQVQRNAFSVTIEEMETTLKIIADQFHAFCAICDTKKVFKFDETDKYFKNLFSSIRLGYVEMLS